MKRYAKKCLGRRFKKLSGPTVINIHGLYLEASTDDAGSLFDFVQMITHAVKGETKMEKELTPEQKAKAAKMAMIENLERAVCLEGGAITSLRYYDGLEMVRIQHDKGCSICISAEGKNAFALLYETLFELRHFLLDSIYRIGWHESFGPDSNFIREKLSK